MAEKVTFQTNILQELALAYPEGKEVASNFAADGKQIMFTLVDGRVMFLNSTVAQRVEALKLQAREPFEIGRMEKVEGNRKRVEWHIAKVGFAPGEGAAASQATAPAPVNGNHHNQAAPPVVMMPSNGTTRNGANGTGTHGPAPATAPAESPYEHTGWSLFLTQQTNVLIDVYARCLAYASQQYGNAVKPEDVRALLTTTFIQHGKGGAR